MELTVQLPDDIATTLGDRAQLEREVLESFVADAYRTERISRRQVSILLGFDYWQTEAFLTAHDAKRPYTLDDLEVDRKSLGTSA